MPTLLMTLLSRFCMSNRRLYQLSDSEVTSPEAAKGARSCRQRQRGPRHAPSAKGRPGKQCGEGPLRSLCWRTPRWFQLLFPVPWYGGLRKGAWVGGRPAGASLTNHAVDRAEEHGALCGGGGLAQILHDQRAVAKDVDEFAQVEETHLLEVLPLLVGGGGTERQCEKLTARTSWPPTRPRRGRNALDATCSGSLVSPERRGRSERLTGVAWTPS